MDKRLIFELLIAAFNIEIKNYYEIKDDCLIFYLNKRNKIKIC